MSLSVTDLGRWVTPARSVAAAAILYAVVTGYGVLNDGYHSDDWRHLTGASPLWVAVEGRWLLDLIYRALLGEHFLLPVQLALAFPCFFATAWLIAGRAAPPDLRGTATLVIFAIGVNHPFMSDALSFAANVFAYPLSLFLSVAAFVLIERCEGASAPRQAAMAAVAALLLSFSIGIYQTFAVAGLIIPALALMRADRVGFGAAVRLALIGALASVAALALYLAEWRLYAGLQGVSITANRFQATDAAGMAAKLGELPMLMRRLQTGSLVGLPFGVRAMLGFLSLIVLALGGLAALRMLAGRLSGGRLLGPLRIGLAVGLAFFVFPVLFRIGYEDDEAPARAFGYFGFWVAALFLAALTMTSSSRAVRGIGTAALGLPALVLALTASAFWSDSARMGQRDIELARAIEARLVSLPGYDGGAFRLVGGVDYPDLSWGTLAFWSSFHGGNPSIGIFRELYGQADYTVSLPASPRPCRAFPAAESTFVHDGIPYVCLEDFAAFTDELRCAELSGAPGQKLCLGPDIMVHLGPDCLPTGAADPALTVAFRSAGRSYAPARSFSAESFPVRLGPLCATMALAPRSPDLTALEVVLNAPSGEVLRQENIPADSLRPAAP